MTCVFCEIVAGRAPAHMVAEDERTVAFMDIAPLTPGHVLVVPRLHTAALWEMATADGEALMRTTLRVAAALEAAFRPEGINLFHATGEAAGQSVFHVHLHVVPRWRGDRFRPPIVPDRAQPEDLAAHAVRIRAAMPPAVGD